MSTSAKNAAQSEARKADKSAPTLVLRGTQRDDKHPTGYDTTVLLFQAQGAAHLQGFVQVGGQRRQVIAHINERKPGESGESKPNYLRVVELDPATEKWNVIGHGNAVNRRSDDKPIYYDEVLLNVEGETLRARVVKGVSDDLHRSMGFEQPRVPRPGSDDEKHSDGAPAPAAPAEPAPPARSRARSRG